MKTSNQFDPNCVCGGTRERPQPDDCERCQFVVALAAETKRADEAEEARIDATESDLRSKMLLEDAEEQLTAATSRAEALENGIRTFLTQHSELQSHEYNVSISHLPANCQWAEAAKKEAAVLAGLRDLLPPAKEVDGGR